MLAWRLFDYLLLHAYARAYLIAGVLIIRVVLFLDVISVTLILSCPHTLFQEVSIQFELLISDITEIQSCLAHLYQALRL